MYPSWSQWLARWQALFGAGRRRPRRRGRPQFVRPRFECLEARVTPSTFGGGVRVAAADVNGDGFMDIVTGAGPGGGPHVKVYSGKDGSLLRSFYAYEPTFAGG